MAPRTKSTRLCSVIPAKMVKICRYDGILYYCDLVPSTLSAGCNNILLYTKVVDWVCTLMIRNASWWEFPSQWKYQVQVPPYQHQSGAHSTSYQLTDCFVHAISRTERIRSAGKGIICVPRVSKTFAYSTHRVIGISWNPICVPRSDRKVEKKHEDIPIHGI